MGFRTTPIYIYLYIYHVWNKYCAIRTRSGAYTRSSSAESLPCADIIDSLQCVPFLAVADLRSRSNTYPHFWVKVVFVFFLLSVVLDVFNVADLCCSDLGSFFGDKQIDKQEFIKIT